jgi:hypothetical protein
MENKLMELFKAMDDNTLMDVWREYCEQTNRFDDEIYTMDLFDDFYCGMSPVDIATRCFYGHDEWSDESSFNPNRDYFYLNGYGNPVSIDYIGYNEYSEKFMCSILDVDAMIDFIIDNENDLNNPDIADILEDN